MPKPTAEQIEQEIKDLAACKEWAPKRNYFGDDNHRNIDLQIEELRDGIDDTAAEFDEMSESQQSAIMEAKNWKEGESEEKPSAGWDDFKKKAKK